MEKKGRLTKLLISEKKIQSKLFEYLTNKELFNLTQLCKLANVYFKQKKDEIKKQKFETILRKFDEYKKKKNLQKISLLKTIEIIKNMTINSNFKLVKDTELKEKLKSKCPNKLFKDSNFLFFYSNQLDKFMIIRRVWLDKNMNILKIKPEEEEKLQLDTIIEEINSKIGFNTNYYQKHLHLQEKLKDLKKENVKEEIVFEDLFNLKQMAIVLYEGGDFSLVIYKDFKEVVHTSQHKYIIRKKGGGKKQSEKDRTKTIKSIGSQIRRENEKLLLSNMEESIKQNRDLLDKCDLILLFAPGMNTNVLIKFFKNCDINVDKVRSLGMDINKAKYNEVVNCFNKLTKLYFI